MKNWHFGRKWIFGYRGRALFYFRFYFHPGIAVGATASLYHGFSAGIDITLPFGFLKIGWLNRETYEYEGPEVVI